MFAILEPITFPKAISEEPSNAACKLTSNSGADVANETTVIPMTSLEILNLKDNATEERTKNSPPITNKISPKITQSKLMKNNFQRRYYFHSFYNKN
ncbi:hypothetical protein GCM10011531_17830 [Aquaticitalea lipolytica]|uniref:Uncharacterized protein n=1 Tax=Aquaticitalea lipolytica TaxID=1247562 RepID=A0A8J2TUN1_9FLAO|nr:hypothetical protein GCM10011531_17830 [Aquaticitalea lipolytica]